MNKRDCIHDWEYYSAENMLGETQRFRKCTKCSAWETENERYNDNQFREDTKLIEGVCDSNQVTLKVKNTDTLFKQLLNKFEKAQKCKHEYEFFTIGHDNYKYCGKCDWYEIAVEGKFPSDCNKGDYSPTQMSETKKIDLLDKDMIDHIFIEEKTNLSFNQINLLKKAVNER